MVPGSGHELRIDTLLDTVERRGDVLVVRQRSPFIDKLYRFAEQWPERPSLFRRFFLLLHNTSAVRLVYEHEIRPLSARLEGIVPRKDLYLAELAAVTSDRSIVTTDQTLKDRLDGQEGFRVHLLDDFLVSYQG